MDYIPIFTIDESTGGLSDSPSNELPLEDDETLLLSTIKLHYPDATGIKFWNDATNTFRTLRNDNGVISPPKDEAGWANKKFVCIVPSAGSISANTENEGERSNGKKRDPELQSIVLPEDYASQLATRTKTIDLLVTKLPTPCDYEDLKDYLSKFGEIDMLEIKKKPNGENKRFGFVRFVDCLAQRRCLNEEYHPFGDSDLVIKRSGGKEGKFVETKRLYVACKDHKFSTDELKEYFTRFGHVTQVYFPNSKKNFCFVNFLAPAGVGEVIDEAKFHKINGHSVECRPAEDDTLLSKSDGPSGGRAPKRFEPRDEDFGESRYRGREPSGPPMKRRFVTSERDFSQDSNGNGYFPQPMDYGYAQYMASGQYGGFSDELMMQPPMYGAPQRRFPGPSENSGYGSSPTRRGGGQRGGRGGRGGKRN